MININFRQRNFLRGMENFADEEKLVNKIRLPPPHHPVHAQLQQHKQRQLMNFQPNPRTKFLRNYSPRNFCARIKIIIKSFAESPSGRTFGRARARWREFCFCLELMFYAFNIHWHFPVTHFILVGCCSCAQVLLHPQPSSPTPSTA